MIRLYRLLIPISIILTAALACNTPAKVQPSLSPFDEIETLSLSPVTSAASLSPSPVVTRSSTPSPTVTLTPTPEGCERPPDDYTRVTLHDGIVLNQRTVWMLEHAQVLYGGTHDFLLAITQGSYNPGVSASFGTHDGGGAVDLSMRDLNDFNHVLYDEANQMISGLRRAGFAAWVRDAGILYDGSPLHIHAIAVGDAELSPAAQSQLTGPEGYFRGMNGLPDNTQPDTYGGPILCPWMIEMGYSDLRSP
jgi:hypothetical protein